MHALLLLMRLVYMLPQTADTKGFGWLDFDMSKEKKMELFKRGATAGVTLLKR
jgi:hypothetical protein